MCERAERLIPGWPHYSVTDGGDVYRLTTKDGAPTRIRLTPWINAKTGYPMVSLWTNGRKTAHGVHRLVALAFLGPPPTPKHQVRHIDGTRTNSRLSNLAWCTVKENAADRKVHGTEREGERNGWHKLTEANVREIRERAASGESGRAIARRFGIAQTTAARVARGAAWKHVTVNAARRTA